MTDEAQVDLDELERLHAEATAGPWFFNSYSSIFSAPMSRAYDAAEEALPPDADDAAYAALPEAMVAYVPASHGDTAGPQACLDAKFIVALHNAFPALAAELRALRLANASMARDIDAVSGILADMGDVTTDEVIGVGEVCRELKKLREQVARARNEALEEALAELSELPRGSVEPECRRAILALMKKGPTNG
jgi:hypothetical protein